MDIFVQGISFESHVAATSGFGLVWNTDHFGVHNLESDVKI